MVETDADADGAVDRVSVDAVEETEGLRAERAVAEVCDAPGVTERRLDGVEEVAEPREAVEDGLTGGAEVVGVFAAERRAWRVVVLEAAAVDSLADRSFVGEAAPPTLGGRALEELVGAGFEGVGFDMVGRGCAIILVTLSQPTNRPCSGVHWK